MKNHRFFLFSYFCIFFLFPTSIFAFVELKEVVPASARNARDGAIDIESNGNTGPFRYQWNNGATTEDVKDLSPGIYGVTITNRFGVEYYLYATVPVCPVYLDIKQKDKLLQQHNTELDLTIEGGNPPFGYLWNTKLKTQDIIVNEDGKFCVEVTDAFCGKFFECTILKDKKLTKTNNKDVETIKIFPNPFASEINILLPDSFANKNLSTFLYDESGREVFKSKIFWTGSNLIKLDLKDKHLSDGNFFLKICEENSAFQTFKLTHLKEYFEINKK